MRYRKMREDRDYILGAKPDEAFLKDSEAVVQAIITHVNLLLDEWWEDLDEGFPLFTIQGQFNDVETVELMISERIASTKGVKRVYDVTSDYNPDRRKYAYTCTIDTVFDDSVSIRLTYNGTEFIRV